MSSRCLATCWRTHRCNSDVRDEEGVERDEEEDGIDDAEVEHLLHHLLNCVDEVATGRHQLD